MFPTLFPTISALLFLTANIAALPTIAPNGSTCANSSLSELPPPITLRIHSFNAFIPYPVPHSQNRRLGPETFMAPPSYVSFQFEDLREKFPLSTFCVLEGSSIYLRTDTFCEDRVARFRLTEGQLILRRMWLSADGKYMYTGEAPQGTYWKEGVNKTVGEQGVTYTRTTDWEFPIKSVW